MVEERLLNMSIALVSTSAASFDLEVDEEEEAALAWEEARYRLPL